MFFRLNSRQAVMETFEWRIVTMDSILLLAAMLPLLANFLLTAILQLESNFGILLIDFSLTVKAATLIFKSGLGSAIATAKHRESGYNLVNN